MKPDPFLKKVAQEIKDVCAKNDVAGYIVLASKGHGEYTVHLPSWSKLQVEEKDGRSFMRFKAEGKDDDKSIVGTVHMIQVFHKVASQVQAFCENLLEKLETKMFITGGPKRIS